MLIISLLLAALVGFAIHRASLCTVRAVAELISTRRAFMLSAFAKTVLWVLAVTMALLLIPGAEGVPAKGWPISPYPVVGGFVFGLGAAMNGGCAYSMLGRLANGDGRMVLALGGFCLGAFAGRQGIGFSGLIVPDPSTTIFHAATGWVPIALTGLVIWTTWEFYRLWRTRPKAQSWKSLSLARTYRLSTAAALLGIANGVLYAVHGSWAYTSTLDGWAQSFAGVTPPPDWTGRALAGALVLGAMISAWQRGSIDLDWRPSPTWVTNALGGSMMGFGAAIAPGGNDALIQHYIPGLSPHALIAYGAMLLGIAAVLIGMRLATGAMMVVDCRGDVCRGG